MANEINPKVAEESLQEFEGCDGGDAGSPQRPSIWLFGIEHGALPSAAAKVKATGDDTYSIDEQLTYTFNMKAFKLLAAMNGEAVDQYKTFAKRHQPFVKGSKGYFKGNIYPYACQNVKVWPSDAQEEVGLTKDEYRAWCDENRIPMIHSWVNKYQPKLFIGVGLSAAPLFSRAVFGKERSLEDIRIMAANGQNKRLLRATDGWRKLVVLPHLSGGPDGLNSDDSVQQAGKVLAETLGG